MILLDIPFDCLIVLVSSDFFLSISSISCIELLIKPIISFNTHESAETNKLIFNNSLSNVSSSEIPSPDGTSSIKIYSGTVKASVSDWEVKSICIKSVSTVNGLIKLEKEYYSNYIIVYKVSPTVAYRKNQLGINTDNPNNDAILTIYPSSNYKKIRFINGLGEEIELDLIKPYNNSSYPAITVKKDTTEYTLFFD